LFVFVGVGFFVFFFFFLYFQPQQDELLDVLATSLTRQKEIALDIGKETEEQVGLLDRLDHRSERSRKRVEREIQRIETFSLKSSTCWLWIIIFILVVVLCVVIVVAVYFPKNQATQPPVNGTMM
jgi:hypothetical protein